MKTLTFPNGDAQPALGLGTWKSARGEVAAAVKSAIEMGYRHIDCAHIYGNEGEIGEALAELFAAGVVRREELWITSKLWNDSHAPADVRPAIAVTLKNLQLDYLDLYLIHWPISLRKNAPRPLQADGFISPADLPLSTTWAAMEDLVDAGLTRHVGVSNCNIPKIAALLETARHAPACNQIELHPYLQQPELVRWCLDNGIQVTA
ncbi:MAG: aldo/keto reductase, partial [Myxococcota bacterium]